MSTLKTMIGPKAGILGLAAAAAVGAPALAHHSFSMFDSGKTVTLTGVVRAWEMVNPHSYLWLNVAKDGKVQVWGLESAAPAGLIRSGLTKSSLKPGDTVTVDLNPLRDGRTGGMLRRVVLADGRAISFGGPIGGRPAPAAAPAGAPR